MAGMAGRPDKAESHGTEGAMVFAQLDPGLQGQGRKGTAARQGLSGIKEAPRQALALVIGIDRQFANI